MYVDGTTANTTDHTWHVHTKAPERKDAVSWQRRCTTAGGHFNPYKVEFQGPNYDQCKPSSPEFCELGDLATRLGKLKIVANKKYRTTTRVFFTDTFLPMSGRNSIIGKSITVHSEDKNENRGNRLGCAPIVQSHRQKGVVRTWHSDDSERKVVGGTIEFFQESPYDPTTMKLNLNGLGGLAGGYHVHEGSVEVENDLPCLGVYGHWNPFEVESHSTAGKAEKLSTDLYEVGDLSSKQGNLNTLQDIQATYNDTNLPLFGNNSIMGRSIVVHKAAKGDRWSCGSVEWGYSLKEARQRSAIASFHHPKGFAYGYIRFVSFSLSCAHD
jgi:Cu/Zn superoxide dismutase